MDNKLHLTKAILQAEGAKLKWKSILWYRQKKNLMF